jgi:putative DNA primase/helicase
VKPDQPNSNKAIDANGTMRLASEGFRLFPVEPRGKKPLIRSWQSFATNNGEQLSAWFEEFPDCNWALATGAGSGIFVLDFDGEPGRKLFMDWIEQHGQDWAATRTVKTARGFHLWYRWPEGNEIRNSAGKIALGVDVRGEGGYILVPPSVHPDGLRYEWLDSAPIAEAPSWLLALAGRPQTALSNMVTRGHVDGQRTIPEGQRNSTLASLAGSMRRRGMSGQAIVQALLVHNREHCSPPLPNSEVEDVAASVARYAPSQAVEFSDAGNGMLFVARNAKEVRFCRQRSKIGWYVWNGILWCEDVTGQVMELARETTEEMKRAAAEKLAAAKTENEIAAAKAELSWAIRSRSNSKLVAMLAQASQGTTIAVESVAFDRNPELLNLQNGTLNLTTFEFGPARREDLITMVAGVGYDANAECPSWRKFIADVTNGREELAAYLERVAGYLLTGSQAEQKALVIYGAPGTGKSTFWKVLKGLLGDYFAMVPPGLFLKKPHVRRPDGNAATPGLASLIGKRVAASTEMEPGDKFDDAMIKSFTGGDYQVARPLYLPPFEFKPQAKLVFLTNHLPGTEDFSGAMQDRLQIVEFKRVSAAARLPTFLIFTSRPRSSSGLSSDNTLFICPECFQKAETMRSLPRGVRATIRTRRSSTLSTRLTRPFATRRSTAVLIEPGVRSTIGPIVLTGKGPLRSRSSSTPKSERPSPVSSIPAD